jgi:hypothetical protein
VEFAELAREISWQKISRMSDTTATQRNCSAQLLRNMHAVEYSASSEQVSDAIRQRVATAGDSTPAQANRTKVKYISG